MVNETKKPPVEPDAMGNRPGPDGKYPHLSSTTGLPADQYELDAQGRVVPKEEKKPRSIWEKIKKMW